MSEWLWRRRAHRRQPTQGIFARCTEIAFDQLGPGPALILTVGAFNEPSPGIPLATFLTPHFSVFTYDR